MVGVVQAVGRAAALLAACGVAAAGAEEAQQRASLRALPRPRDALVAASPLSSRDEAAAAAQRLLLASADQDLVSFDAAAARLSGVPSLPMQPTPIPCHTAVPGEACYVNVVWAMGQGVLEEPLAFPGLTPLSSFRAFQNLLHRQGGAGCSEACNATRGGFGSGLSAPTSIKIPSASPAETKVNRDPFKPSEDCLVPKSGDECDGDIHWGRKVGIFKHPEWYDGLSYDSSYAEFQDFLHRNGHSVCKRPCKLSKCLCLFDVDNTLTSQYSNGAQCRDTAPVGGVPHLRLSEMVQKLQQTFCGRCFRGVVAEGDLGGSGSAERFALHKALGGEHWTLSNAWSEPAPQVTSALVLNVEGHMKQESVQGVVDWLRQEKNVTILPGDVWFFDDDARNTPSFLETGFNARQVSCANRAVEEAEGRCGARVLEMIPNPGVHGCFGPFLREEPDAATLAAARQAAEGRGVVPLSGAMPTQVHS